MKNLLLTSLIVCGLVFTPIIGVNAQEAGSLYGGVYYTTLADTDLDTEGDELSLDLTSGFGFNAGGEMQMTPEFGVAAEFSRIFVSDSDSITETGGGVTATGEVEANLPVNAIRGNAVLNLNELMEQENLPDIKIKGGAGYYFGELDFEGEVTVNGETYEEYSESEDLSGFGFRIGASVEQEVTDDFSVKGDIGYRILDLENGGDDVNANGVELGAGVAYSF